MCFSLLWNNPHVLKYTVKICQSDWFKKTLFPQEPGRWGDQTKNSGKKKGEERPFRGNKMTMLYCEKVPSHVTKHR